MIVKLSVEDMTELDKDFHICRTSQDVVELNKTFHMNRLSIE